jgi:hypothetical protein
VDRTQVSDWCPLQRLGIHLECDSAQYTSLEFDLSPYPKSSRSLGPRGQPIKQNHIARDLERRLPQLRKESGKIIGKLSESSTADSIGSSTREVNESSSGNLLPSEEWLFFPAEERLGASTRGVLSL